jgi:hypothetical protein
MAATPRKTPARKPAGSTTASRAPKPPQDRKKPAAVIAADRAPLGHDYLKPVALLRSSEQAILNADLIALFEGMGVDMSNIVGAAAAEDEDELAAAVDEAFVEGEEPEAEPEGQVIEMNSEAVRAMAKMSALLEDFVLPEHADDFVQLDTGKGALNRISDLGMWYLEALGE